MRDGYPRAGSGRGVFVERTNLATGERARGIIVGERSASGGRGVYKRNNAAHGTSVRRASVLGPAEAFIEASIGASSLGLLRERDSLPGAHVQPSEREWRRPDSIVTSRERRGRACQILLATS
jgi:hypothetical protein